MSPILKVWSTSAAAEGAVRIQCHDWDHWEAPTSTGSLSYWAYVWLMWKSHHLINNNNNNNTNNSNVYSSFLNTQRGIHAAGAHRKHTHASSQTNTRSQSLLISLSGLILNVQALEKKPFFSSGWDVSFSWKSFSVNLVHPVKEWQRFQSGFSCQKACERLARDGEKGARWNGWCLGGSTCFPSRFGKHLTGRSIPVCLTELR